MAESEAFNGDQNDASIKAMSLNSPEVPINKRDSISENDQDGVPNLRVPFRSVNSILNLSREEKNKNESRRVSFPDDDKIISGYGEPRNPWAQAKTTSTEDLIQAYTQACQQWGVKPITKLLMQLQEITDFSIRAHSLTLKGEKLDSKVVETLESVFKRVQFVIMDLEATNLDDDSAASLFDMIEYYESAVNVLIGFNRNLGTNGWQAAAHMMRKMSCLRLFDAHSVPLTDQAVPFVGRALRLSNTLVTLHLENASLSGRPMLLIFAALRMNVTLRELFLADNRLLSTDALQIANLLKFNFILQLLDIRNNLIQDVGLSHLCSGIMTQPQNGACGLQTLVLWNNQISHQSMSKLATALRYTNNLSTLNLGQNVLGDDGAAKLKDGLLQNHSLLRLGMVGTKVTCEGAIALAEFLAESPRIIRLDLRNNNIKVGGLMALSLAFKINFSLLRLDIDKPNAKDTLKELAEKQESLISDISLYAARNKESALRRVYLIQQERMRTEEEKTSGLRYMDMTNSGIQISSTPIHLSHNSNNNRLQQQQQHATDTEGGQPQKQNINNLQQNMLNSVVPQQQQQQQQLLQDVDDSPINSPELLPSNSVSYHQVAPVMFSSSEMEKRAQAQNSQPSNDVTHDVTDDVFTPDPKSDITTFETVDNDVTVDKNAETESSKNTDTPDQSESRSTATPTLADQSEDSIDTDILELVSEILSTVTSESDDRDIDTVHQSSEKDFICNEVDNDVIKRSDVIESGDVINSSDIIKDHDVTDTKELSENEDNHKILNVACDGGLPDDIISDVINEDDPSIIVSHYDLSLFPR
ncbi:uncharacterized protein LOC100186281 [Ciona intestinalis]